MSGDLTNPPRTDSDILRLILTIVKGLDSHLGTLGIRFTSLEVRFTGLEGRFDRLQTEMRREIRDLNNVVNDLSHKQIVLTDIVRQIDANLRDVFERLHIVEVSRNQQNSST